METNTLNGSFGSKLDIATGRKRSFDETVSGSCDGLCNLAERPEVQNKRLKLQNDIRCGCSGGAMLLQNSDVRLSGFPSRPSVNIFSQLEQQMHEDPIAIVSRTLGILAVNQFENEVYLYCFQTLRTVTPLLLLGGISHPEFEEAFHNHAVNTILTCMKRHLLSKVVQIEAGKILQRLVTFDNNGKEPYPEGKEKPYVQRAVVILGAAVECHFNDVSIQCLLFDLVRRFKSSDSLRAHWIGCTSSILRAIERHLKVSYIQQIGLSLIAWLTEEANCREIVVQGGGIRIIPQIMEAHPHDPLIQCNAAAALCWLVHAGGFNGRCQLEHKHISTVLQVLKIHQDNASAFGNCVCLLFGLNHADTDVPLLFQMILKGMKTHITSSKVLEGCLRWMRFRDPEEFPDEFESAIPTILQAFRIHTEDAHLLGQAVELLTVFAGVESLRDKLVAKGAIDLVLDMLKKHRHDSRVQQGTVWFLTLSMRAQMSTIAFGGGFDVLEVIWQGLGIGDDGTEQDGPDHLDQQEQVEGVLGDTTL